MAQKKSYSRYFIILQEDEKGYALASDKLPSGYAKLEIKNDKCKISYYVQNLKKESAPYYMILICGKKDVKKIIKLGELNIDDHGRAEIAYEYQADNLANCGINVDRVIGAGIVKFMNTNILSVMSGFASTDIPDWKNFPIIEEEMKREEEPKEDAKPEESVEVKTEEKTEEIKTEQRNVFEEYEKKIEEEKSKVEEGTAEGAVKEEKAAKEERGTEETIKEEKAVKEERAAEEPIKEENVQETHEETSKDIPRTSEKADDEVEEEEYAEEEIDENDETRHKKKKKSKKSEYEVKCEEKKEEKCKSKCEDKKEEKCKSKCEDKKEVKLKEKCEDSKEDKCKGGYCPIYEKCDKDYPKGKAGAFFMEAAKGFEEVEGICSEIKRCRWYKVPVHCLEDMTACTDYNKYTVAYYPMINYFQYIIRFQHFVLGYKCDKEGRMKYLVYGVPGTKSRKDQPLGGRSGFVTWVPLREGEENEASLGYWLMFYDFRSSTIVVPVK